MPAKAVGYSLLAARNAAQTGHYAQAVVQTSLAESVLRASRSVRPHCTSNLMMTIALELGQAYGHLGRAQAAAEAHQRAASLAAQLGHLQFQGAALLGWAETTLSQGRCQEAQTLARRSMQPSLAVGCVDAVLRAHLVIGRAGALQGWAPRSLKRAERAMETWEDARSDATAARYVVWRGELCLAAGRPNDAVPLLNRAADLGQRAGDRHVYAQSWARLAQALLLRGRWGQALRLSREAMATARSTGDLLTEVVARCVSALVLTRIGAADEAVPLLLDVLPNLEAGECRTALATACWVVGEAEMAASQHEQAGVHLNQALSLGRESHLVETTARALLGLSQLAAGDGNWSEAQRLCIEVRARARQADLDLIVVQARIGLAEVYLGQGAQRTAQQEALRALDTSHRLTVPYESLRAAATVGEALRALGHEDQAKRYCQEATEVARQLAGTLPADRAPAFLQSPFVRSVCLDVPERQDSGGV